MSDLRNNGTVHTYPEHGRSKAWFVLVNWETSVSSQARRMTTAQVDECNRVLTDEGSRCRWIPAEEPMED